MVDRMGGSGGFLYATRWNRVLRSLESFLQRPNGGQVVRVPARFNMQHAFATLPSDNKCHSLNRHVLT
jgi:hypothetical protein